MSDGNFPQLIYQTVKSELVGMSARAFRKMRLNQPCFLERLNVALYLSFGNAQPFCHHRLRDNGGFISFPPTAHQLK